MENKKITILPSEENITSDTKVISKAPLCIDISSSTMRFKAAAKETIGKLCENDYIIIDLEFCADSRTFIDADFFSGGKKIINLNYSIIPNRRIKIAFPLCELASKRWYLTPHPGNLKGHVQGQPAHISEIDEVYISSRFCRGGKKITIYDMYISDMLPDFTVNGKPMVDMFGQNKDKEFPGKIHSEKELADYLKSEHDYAAAHNSYSNPDWNKYGGYKKLKFEKTGAFHTHFDGKRWWLVDPDGCAFISNGICYGSRMGVHGFIDGMENLFEWLPDKKDPVFKDAWTTADNIPEFVKRNGAEAGKSRYMFNFARANMIRVFGDKWWDAWCTINSARLKRWGFNTISVCVNNYFDENVYEYLKKAEIPYTLTLKGFPKTKKMIFRDFPDVFSPEYKTLCEKFAKQLQPLAGDKYMIGYFINNEPEWLVAREANIAEQLITSSEPLYSKKEFVNFIKSRYGTEIQFNSVWKLGISNFDELLNPISENLDKNAEILKDLNDFRDVLITAYNKIPLDAVKKYAPDNLCLGMRYANIQKNDLAGFDYYDSFSFNCYSGDPSQTLKVAENIKSVPYIIGEWHIGASDTSLLCSALVTCKNETERGKACFNYIQTAFSAPGLVGAHYFEYNDQPLLGRFDGEAMPHGLIDICNRPHEECMQYLSEINNHIYEHVLGKYPHCKYKVEFLPSF